MNAVIAPLVSAENIPRIFPRKCTRINSTGKSAKAKKKPPHKDISPQTEGIIIMKNSFSESYKKPAGVDVTAGYEGVRLMKKDVERTNIPGVLTGIGGFGGLFQLDIADMKEPVLVSGNRRRRHEAQARNADG